MGIKEPAHASWKALKASCLETALFLRPTFFVIFFLLFFHSYRGVADGAGSPGPAACVLPGQEEHCPTRGLPQAFPFPRGLLSFVKLIWLQILMALPQRPGGAGCSAACRDVHSAHPCSQGAFGDRPGSATQGKQLLPRAPVIPTGSCSHCTQPFRRKIQIIPSLGYG